MTENHEISELGLTVDSQEKWSPDHNLNVYLITTLMEILDFRLLI